MNNQGNSIKYQVGDRVWVPHDKEAFVPGVIETILPNRIDVKLEGQLVPMKINFSPNTPPKLDICGGHLHDNLENLVDLDELSEGAILHHVRKRYMKKNIYTLVGNILVAVNPFENLDIYGPKDIEKAKSQIAISPHVYSIASQAYQQLIGNRTNQSILISGESGAGKTETTKRVLTYIASVAAPIHHGANDIGIEEKILQSNPLLEALGNAKTLRNNNSSRFGKWMKIDFSASNFRVEGCEIVNYLLEKSRVVFQADQERNYHIFYMLIRGLKPNQHNRFHIRPHLNFYNYLNQSGCMDVPGIDDRKSFEEVEQALHTLQFSSSRIDDLWKLLSAILLLGNLEFMEGTSSETCRLAPESLTMVEEIAELLQVDSSALSFCLTDKWVQMGRGSVVGIKLSLRQALEGRDSLAKMLYSKLFDFVIHEVNQSLQSNSTSQSALLDGTTHKKSNTTTGNSIGILDIFGFESFEINSFEQLCINYANEKLQKHFNDVIFREERLFYESEGIEVPEINYVDNSACVQLIEGRPIGILSLLDEECSLGNNGSETSFLNKLEKSFATGKNGPHPFFLKGRSSMASSGARGGSSSSSSAVPIFTVKHFAGAVSYVIENFLDKSRDSLSQTSQEMIQQSRSALMKRLFVSSTAATSEENGDENTSNGNRNKAKGKSNSSSQTLGAQFRSQLQTLIATLAATESQFIRCVKPNAEKVPKVLDGHLTLQQLRYAGLFDAIRLRQAGFAYRNRVEVFWNTYRLCLPGIAATSSKLQIPWKTRNSSSTTTTSTMSSDEIRHHCQSLLQACTDQGWWSTNDWRIGQTRIFLKSAQQRTRLEKLRQEGLDRFIRPIQALVRGFLGRCRVRAIKEVLYAEVRKRQAAFFRKIKAAVTIQRHFRGWWVRLSLEVLGDLLELRRAVSQHDSLTLKAILDRLERSVLSSSSSSSSSMESIDSNNASKSMVENPRSSASTNPRTGAVLSMIKQEIRKGRLLLKWWEVQQHRLEGLRHALRRQDRRLLEKALQDCQQVDLAYHEEVQHAQQLLQSWNARRHTLQFLVDFLEAQQPSSKTSTKKTESSTTTTTTITTTVTTTSTSSSNMSTNAPLRASFKTTAEGFNHPGIVKREKVSTMFWELEVVESQLAQAKAYGLDPSFLQKVERILQNSKPRFEARNRLRRAIETVDVIGMLQALNTLAPYAGLSSDFSWKSRMESAEISNAALMNPLPAATTGTATAAATTSTTTSTSTASKLRKFLLAKDEVLMQMIVNGRLGFAEVELRAARTLLTLIANESYLEPIRIPREFLSINGSSAAASATSWSHEDLGFLEDSVEGFGEKEEGSEDIHSMENHSQNSSTASITANMETNGPNQAINSHSNPIKKPRSSHNRKIAPDNLRELDYDTPRLTTEMWNLCDAITQMPVASSATSSSTTQQQAQALKTRLLELCCGNDILLERVIRSFKWSKMVCIWKYPSSIREIEARKDNLDAEDKMMMMSNMNDEEPNQFGQDYGYSGRDVLANVSGGEEFFGLNFVQAKKNLYILKMLHPGFDFLHGQGAASLQAEVGDIRTPERVRKADKTTVLSSSETSKARHSTTTKNSHSHRSQNALSTSKTIVSSTSSSSSMLDTPEKNRACLSATTPTPTESHDIGIEEKSSEVSLLQKQLLESRKSLAKQINVKASITSKLGASERPRIWK